MVVLVLGANGATGSLVVEELINRGHTVKGIVRSPDKLPTRLREHSPERWTVIKASILELSDAELAEQVKGCDAVVSCLGHNMTLKGIYGQPRKLVTDAARRICSATRENASDRPTKFVLMNTAGNSNRDLQEPVSFAHRCVIGLLRVLVPPHVDNEQAADFLRNEIGQNDKAIQWVVVRPDSLTNEDEVTDYAAHPSPTRSAIFNSGSTSRINVGHFMAELIDNEEVWCRWKGQMPVLYNSSAS